MNIRKSRIHLSVLLTAAALLLSSVSAFAGDKIFMYTSLWDRYQLPGGKGIALYTFDKETGDIAFVKKLSDVSFNATQIDQEKGILYLCNETPQRSDLKYMSGAVYAFKINKQTGELTELNHQFTHAPDTTFLELSADKKYMVVASHNDPTHVTTIEREANGDFVPRVRFSDAPVELFKMNDDGSIGKIVDVVKHTQALNTDPVNPKQNQPHMTLRAPLYKDLFIVPDKGDGYVYMYTIDRANNKLRNTDKVLALDPDRQPRYAAYHPTKPFVFVNHEGERKGEMLITSFKYNESGKLTKIGDYSVLLQSLDTSKATTNSQQGFIIHPNGKYVYSICRNPKMVAVMQVNEETGALKAIQNAPVTGLQPRGIGMTPDGKFIVTGSIMSGDISVYAVGADGKLTLADGKSNQAGISYITFYDPKGK